MEKTQAIRLIRKTFQNPFDKESFVYFIKSLLNHIEPAPFIYRGNLIPDAYESYIKTLERIGKYQDKDGKKIDLLIVRLKKEKSLERARTMQRNFIAWYLNGSRGGILKDAALVAFVSPDSEDWRFSLVKMDYRLDTSGEKVKVKQELTPARRFSFLVGKTESSHTAQSRLAPILQDDSRDPTLQDLEEAFSVEKVTKEFFEKYRELFLRVKEALDEIVKKDKKIQQDFKEKNIDTVNFAKKLLGQIVFLYFLQKKGWFGVERDKDWGTDPKNFLRLLFKERVAKYGNFFNEILEPLFYEALAVERTDDFYSRFNCKIPFLNGGLFDPINNYDWVHTDILLPNELFSNSIKTKEGDIGTGILDIFDRYNFTVKEDEPLEKEVAVDPEMLGKVFENLLEVKDRKSKGTYYTPREIVHYMCQESLINYLATELKDKAVKEDIEILIEYGETAVEHDSQVVNKGKETKRYFYKLPQSIRDNAKLIDEKLASIRVCDPAVGSGAFPVGMMNEIVRTRNALTNYLKDKKKRTIYNLKRHAIQNCLYGVDIDPGAVEIAKLRLWLSLIVDEEKIKPLPNLDFKIMQGNSLISEFLGIDFDNEQEKQNEPTQVGLLPEQEDDSLIKKFEQKKIDFQNESDKDKKKKLKEEVENLMIKVFETKIKKQKADYFRKIEEIERKYSTLPNQKHREEIISQEKQKLSKKFGFDLENIKKQLREFTSKKKTRPFFPWKLYFAEVFQEKDGFDIVIANPPYGVKVENDIKEWHGLGSKDSYGVFISTTLKRLLKSDGVLSFIVSDTWLTIKTHKLLREQVLEKQLHKIIRLHQDCFDATVNACVITVTNSPNINGNIIAADLTNISTRKEVEELREKLYHLKKFIGQSTPKFAVYEYHQNLIKTNSNLPIFVGSPKLFALMNDTTCQTKEKEINHKKVKVRQIKINGKVVELVRFGDIARIVSGLTTGDNKYYLFQNPEARGSYKNINDYKQYLLTEEDLEKIRNNEELRLKVIEKGIHKSKNEKDFDEDLWFGGRYIVPYDKGGESDTESGWLPNYYVSTNYFIDWSHNSTNFLLKSLKIRKESGKPYPRNIYYYFREGITFSRTGYYAPSFRLGSSSIFDTEGCHIFCDLNICFQLSILNSKLVKFLLKYAIGHTIHTQVDELKEIPFIISQNKKLIRPVKQIIEKQKQNSRYDYMSNEQKEIDKLVYKMYGLNKNDIREVETWYARRYPKLARFCDI